MMTEVTTGFNKSHASERRAGLHPRAFAIGAITSRILQEFSQQRKDSQALIGNRCFFGSADLLLGLEPVVQFRVALTASLDVDSRLARVRDRLTTQPYWLHPSTALCSY
jgi:hypothetical protein